MINWLGATLLLVILCGIASMTNNPTEFLVVGTLFYAVWNNFELMDIRRKIETTED